METVDLDVEESNELLFKVKIEGSEPAPAKVRLVCEGEEVSYMFSGHPTEEEGVVQFLLPVLKDKLKEGIYSSRVEVLIENRYFAPVAFNINFKKAMRVVAEAVQIPQRRVAPQISVTAAPIVVKKPTPVVAAAPVARPVVIEKPTQAKPVTHKVAPQPARIAARMTLKERYNTRYDEIDTEDDSDDLSEELVRRMAQSFIRAKSKK